MKLEINGVTVVLSDSGKVSKGGRPIFKADGIALKDGTKLYINAYAPSAQDTQETVQAKPVIRRQAKVQLTPAAAVNTASVQAAPAAPSLDAIVQAVMAAMASKA